MIGFIGTHDAILEYHPLLILEPHPGPEEHQRLIIRLAAHDDDVLQALLEKMDAGVYLPELFLAVDIFRVLRALAAVTSGRLVLQRCSNSSVSRFLPSGVMYFEPVFCGGRYLLIETE